MLDISRPVSGNVVSRRCPARFERYLKSGSGAYRDCRRVAAGRPRRSQHAEHRRCLLAFLSAPPGQPQRVGGDTMRRYSENREAVAMRTWRLAALSLLFLPAL